MKILYSFLRIFYRRFFLLFLSFLFIIVRYFNGPVPLFEPKYFLNVPLSFLNVSWNARSSDWCLNNILVFLLPCTKRELVIHSSIFGIDICRLSFLCFAGIHLLIHSISMGRRRYLNFEALMFSLFRLYFL